MLSLVFICFISFYANSENAKDAVNPKIKNEDIIQSIGIIRRVQLEGGFWGIISVDEKEKYLPKEKLYLFRD